MRQTFDKATHPDARGHSRVQSGSGRVILVGAGPGDPGLLTLKAKEVLANADVVLFDDLVSDAVLGLARPGAARVAVGKRGGRRSCAQNLINELMHGYAAAGFVVVRLKAGDPGVFARAGEEIAFLRARDVHAEVVPGITAAAAMAASLGISLTHRDHAQTVQFVTGHSRRGELPGNLNWQTMASSDVTTVVYMARRTAGAIVRKLHDSGMLMTTPVAVAVDVSGPEQEVWTGTLAHLEEGVKVLDSDAPLLLLIGGVAGDVAIPARAARSEAAGFSRNG
ncbi:MAG: uroporphyrinogen-III C-methyltransferase [Pseudomonadota bacterium]